MTPVFYKSLYCIHVRSLVPLLSPGEICHTEPSVGILSTEPFLVGVYYCTNHGVIKCTGITRYHCSTCPSSIPNCNHLEVFKEWEMEDSILEPEQALMDEASKFQHREVATAGASTRKCRTLWGRAWASSYCGYKYMNRLSFTLKWWVESLAFVSVVYARPIPEAIANPACITCTVCE